MPRIASANRRLTAVPTVHGEMALGVKSGLAQYWLRQDKNQVLCKEDWQQLSDHEVA